MTAHIILIFKVAICDLDCAIIKLYYICNQK